MSWRILSPWIPYGVFFALWLVKGVAVWQHWQTGVQIALWLALGGAMLAAQASDRRRRLRRRGDGGQVGADLPRIDG